MAKKIENKETLIFKLAKLIKNFIVKHWKLVIIILLVFGVVFSGFSFTCGNVQFEKTKIDLSKVEQ